MKSIFLIFIVHLFLFTVQAQSTLSFITDCEISGFTQTPRYKETIKYCKALSDASPFVYYTTFGVSPEGRALPLLIVDENGYTSPEDIRKSGKVIICIEACIHSGEPDGKDAGLMFIRDLAIHKKYPELLERISFLFIPIFNVDGHENFSARNRINQNGPEELGTRVTGQLLNMNRDFLKADAPEMQDWLRLFNYWLPELFIDIHVTNGADFQYIVTYNIENNSTYMETGLRNWSSQVFEKKLQHQMASEGYPIFPYFHFLKRDQPESGIEMEIFDPRYSQGYAAARNRIGLLVENHIYKPYKERVLATYQLLLAASRITAKEHKGLLSAIVTADNQTATPEFRKEPIDFAFTSTRKDSVMVDFLGWKRITIKSDLSGGNWTKHDYSQPITIQAPLYTSFEPTISIHLPEAYILMPQWPDIIKRLDLHGIKYERIKKAQSIDVETYRYTKANYAPQQSEGQIPVETEYTTQKEKLNCPEGSLLIDMNQPSARIIAWLLEPSAPGSLTYWGFLNAVVQPPGEFWISLPYMEIKGREMLAKDPELKKELETKKATDPDFAKDPEAILNFFYTKVRKMAANNSDIHPAWRINDRTTIEQLKH